MRQVRAHHKIGYTAAHEPVSKSESASDMQATEEEFEAFHRACDKIAAAKHASGEWPSHDAAEIKRRLAMQMLSHRDIWAAGRVFMPFDR